MLVLVSVTVMHQEQPSKSRKIKACIHIGLQLCLTIGVGSLNQKLEPIAMI
jgi:hypothetical protein